MLNAIFLLSRIISELSSSAWAFSSLSSETLLILLIIPARISLFLNLQLTLPLLHYRLPRLSRIFPSALSVSSHCIYCGTIIRYDLSAFASAHQITLRSLLVRPVSQNSSPHNILNSRYPCANIQEAT